MLPFEFNIIGCLRLKYLLYYYNSVFSISITKWSESTGIYRQWGCEGGIADDTGGAEWPGYAM